MTKILISLEFPLKTRAFPPLFCLFPSANNPIRFIKNTASGSPHIVVFPHFLAFFVHTNCLFPLNPFENSVITAKNSNDFSLHSLLFPHNSSLFLYFLFLF